MAAALLMARLSAEVRLFTLSMEEPTRIVDRLNRDFCQRGIGERFITFLLVVIDPEAHRITVVNAGHAGPIIRRPDASLEILGEGQSGQPLGINLGSSYQTSTASLGPGDLVLLYTDGLIDALDASGMSFGIERLKQILRDRPGTAAEVGGEIIRAVGEHAAGCARSDDITLLIFSRLAPVAT